LTPLVAPYIQQLIPYAPGKPIDEVERELGIQGAIKVASNENPLGPSPKAVEALRAALSKAHIYPDGGAFHLRRKLSERFGLPPEQILVGNGSNELLELLVRAFMSPGGLNGVTSAQTFAIYKLLFQAIGAELRQAPLTAEYRYDLDAMAALVDERTRLVLIANPDNPTGHYIPRDALERFVARIDAGRGDDVPILVLDEAYFEFTDADDYPNGLDLLARRPRTIVLRTFSKVYGLASVRLGYGFTSPELAADVNRLRQPFNVNGLAQVAGVAALDDDEHVARTVALTREGKAVLTQGMTALGLRVLPSQTNFVFVDVARDAQATFQALMRRGVITRPMTGYGFPTALRVSVGTPEQDRRVLEALAEVLDEVPPAPSAAV